MQMTLPLETGLPNSVADAEHLRAGDVRITPESSRIADIGGRLNVPNIRLMHRSKNGASLDHLIDAVGGTCSEAGRT